MVHHHNNNFLSIISGSIIGVFKYLHDIDYSAYSAEVLKVFVFGIIGGAGGLIGKMIVTKIAKLFKRNEQV